MAAAPTKIGEPKAGVRGVQLVTTVTEYLERKAPEHNDQHPPPPSTLLDHQCHVSHHKLLPIKKELTDAESTKPKSAAGAVARGGEEEKKSCDECGTDRMKKKDGSFFPCCAGCGLDFTAPKVEIKEEVTVNEPEVMDFEIIPVTRDTECGFCYARLDEIEVPRALPCGHTQCTECICVNYQNKQIECKVCKEVFSEINIRALPLVQQELVNSALAEPVELIPIHLRCDLCTTDTTRAAVCCADCKKRLCRKHADEHEIHVSDHVMLPIEDDLSPERYDVEKCKTHIKHALDKICKHCMKLFCKRCETKEECPRLTKAGECLRNPAV